VSTPIDTAPRAGDSVLQELAMRALDAARSAGATYADVRFTLTRRQTFMFANPPLDTEHIAVGVRALANGAWGFTGSLSWSPDAVARLGREATAQAKGNAWSGVTPIELDTPPTTLATGTWSTPIRRDPFAVSIEEKLDYLRSAEAYARSFRNGSGSSIVEFERQERTFASTDGAFCSQTMYTSLGGNSQFNVTVMDPVTRQFSHRSAAFFSPRGVGYEVFEDARLFEQIPMLYEAAKEAMHATTMEPSRYDVVFDAVAMARIVDHSIGAALEIDRALGYEANAGGTTYLGPPAQTLGNTLASPLLTVHADRSSPAGAATVRWDDEGIAPEPFTLVRDGVVSDYATTREHVGTMTAWNQTHGHPLRSHGCAGAEHAMTVPLVQTPNLLMQPAEHEADVAELAADVRDGVALLGGWCAFDFQQLNSRGRPEAAYRIRNGKLAEPIRDVAYLIRSPEFWRDLAALGGERSATWLGITTSKGQPEQRTVHSVRAVPARFRNVRVISADPPVSLRSE
jgi:TldD protein